ncbi:MAG: S-methyl-5'-thioadenosine phosphorylase [Candidatus Methylacidiphilales bacterium]
MNPLPEPVPIGILGGSGLYHMEALANPQELVLDTPFGTPSDAYRIGSLGGRRVAFLPRHGRNHTLLPSEIPHRANVHGFKQLGVRWLISVSAVGSLKENLKPRDFVFPLQFFDRTKQSVEHTFFGRGIVAHVSFGRPVCETLATLLYQSATLCGATCHWGGTYVNMEGPAFSTLAECQVHRAADFDVVGMTNLAEAKLAREAEISYATLAMVTDYDCWHSAVGEVQVSDILGILHDNAALAKRTIHHVVQQIPLNQTTPAHRALDSAILTPPSAWPESTRRDLATILDPVLARQVAN